MDSAEAGGTLVTAATAGSFATGTYEVSGTGVSAATGGAVATTGGGAVGWEIGGWETGDEGVGCWKTTAGGLVGSAPGVGSSARATLPDKSQSRPQAISRRVGFTGVCSLGSRTDYEFYVKRR